jgi:hypothetical protein
MAIRARARWRFIAAVAVSWSALLAAQPAPQARLVVSVVDEITEGGSTRHPTRADRIAGPGSFLVLLDMSGSATTRIQSCRRPCRH